MSRRFALVAVWAIFAAAAVGVGFGAAGLVGDPLTGRVSVGDPTAAGTVPADGVSTQPSAGTETPHGSSSAPGVTGEPSGSQPSSSVPPGEIKTTTARPAPTRSAGTADRVVTRSLSTAGGFVSASCRSGLVRLAASPAVGWEIDRIDRDARREAKVRFERSGDADGDLEVTATCRDGRPRFALDEDLDEHGGGGEEESESD